MDANDTRPSFGLISQVVGVDSNGVGIVDNVAYYFKYNSGVGGPKEFGPVRPSNRRPVETPGAYILAARVGDVCGVAWFGNQPSVMIIEGLDPGDCQGNPLTSPPFIPRADRAIAPNPETP